MTPPTDDFTAAYSPPQTPIDAPPPSTPTDFFALFVRWERYRLIYNIILAVEVVALLGVMPTRNLVYVGSYLITGVVGANVCFCAGLILNNYGWWIGWRSIWLSRLIFATGLIVALLLTAMVSLELHAASLKP